VFVFFCEPQFPPNLVRGDPRGYDGIHVRETLSWSPWDLVPQLRSLGVKLDRGEEITPKAIDVLDVLSEHLSNARYSCTLRRHATDGWVEAAHNKFGDAVAGVLGVAGVDTPEGEEPSDPGWVVLLPQVKDPGACVVALLDNVLPVLARKLFPESENTSWLQQPPYELPSVIELEAEIAGVRRDAEQRETELRAAVDDSRARDGWMHTLLTGTDDDLVDAVKTALEELGAIDVEKVDDEAETRLHGRSREDLRIRGRSPLVLVEVKGLTTLPKEADSLQVAKYLVPRIKQWERTDIRGLFVVNQQRSLPALDRVNDNAFQEDVLDNAAQQDLGLLTTVDLFRLVRNKRLWGWPPEAVAPLLYSNGRIAPIPLHYELVGAIDGYFERLGVVTVTVTASGFHVGDDLAFILPIDYEQQSVGSMQVDGKDVARAEAGQRVAIRTHLSKAQARNGVQVFRVGKSLAEPPPTAPGTP
jgi:hypothetical protein